MKPFQYQRTQQYFAQTAGELEPLAADELKALGAKQIRTGFRGVYFSADKETLYCINYTARLITRVLVPLLQFRCRDRNDIYQAGKSIDWSSLFSVNHTFGIFANVTGNENIRHSKFAALCLKDAIVDAFREKTSGKRPNVDAMSPDVWLNLYIENNRGTINLDASGGSLHKRGYRKSSIDAPMQEILAAAIIDASGWTGEKPIYDPMCGSGTLLCEALIKYCNIPAGSLQTDFGLHFLPDFDPRLWEIMKNRAYRNIKPLSPGRIAGSDIDKRAVKGALANLRLLPNGDKISVLCKDYRNILTLENTVIVCNPPYGIRMKSDRLEQFYADLGDFLKQRCKGSEAYIYFGNREMIKKIGLKPSWKKPLKNAGLDGRLVRYVLY